MNELNIELASEFILVAATLMRIKAKMLLPRPELDEQGNEIDPRKDLVERLLQYKQFKESCEDLRVLEDDRSMRPPAATSSASSPKWRCRTRMPRNS